MSIAKRTKNTMKLSDLIEDLEFLLSCGVGEAHILNSTGYTKNPMALHRRLERCGRKDLILRIFEWRAMIDGRQHPKGRAA